jgi:hypothetical protein
MFYYNLSGTKLEKSMRYEVFFMEKGPAAEATDAPQP